VLLHLQLSLVTFSILPPLIFATVLFREKARAAYRLVRMKLSHLNAFLQESLSGIRIIQATASEAHRFHRFDGINQEHKEASLQAVLSYAVFYPAVELLATMAIALIIWYGGGEVLRGALTLGTLVAFLEYIQRFFAPVKDLSEKYNILQAAMASSERIFELLDTPVERGWTTNGRKVGRLRGGIEFRNVWFAYEKNDYVLKDVSFTIAPGEQVALVGQTGAGKSTVVGLLSRFYEPERGRILLDGIDIRDLDLRSLRERIGLVLQEPFLFSGSIKENITLGRRASEERVRQATEMANAHAFLEKLKDRYRGRVFEGGSSLSMGERQLIAFARALALDPDILILDEATSSVDPETEDRLQQALTNLMAGRTVLWIAHRLSTIRSVQRILVFHKGELREEGTHQVLLQRGGIFAKLYRIQLDGRPSFPSHRHRERGPEAGRTLSTRRS
ncbi:MAG: ABC transporter ATP-binding protein, partial [Candidatus Methylomirabilales bacterium]